ncbi:MAG: FtsQ-type POTRA domain-containing protein [Terracidiphilus sp.]|nr:FtsQ-type POTRA domain-containing protein [Terracidiphilus sp.]
MPSIGRVRRGGPGMQPEIEDPDGDDAPRPDWGRPDRTRFGGARSHWWWPASRVGRVFVGLGVAILLGGLGTAGFLLKQSLERDGRFRIEGASNIQAAGLTEVSRAEMLPVFGEDIGRNVFFVPIGERRRELEAIPWIEHATVMRVLPDQIRVNVVERKPVAFTRHGQQIGLVDANGVLLEMSAATMAAHHYSFPVVTGLDAGDKAASRQQRMGVYGRLMAELDANNQHFSEQISEIDLTDPEDARVLMPTQGADILAHFGEDHFLERYQRYKAHVGEWRQQYPQLAAVDLRYEHQVVLEMASGKTQPAMDSPDGAKAADGTKIPDGAAATAEQKPAVAAAKPAGKAAQSKTVSSKTVKGKGAAGKVSPAKAAADKSGKTKSSSAAKTKTATKTTASAKAVAEKKKAEKKHAQAKPAVLKVNKQKPTAATRPQAVEGQ